MKLTVHVPATTANLGPGFDCLGLALDLWNTIVIEDSPSQMLEVRVRGDDTGIPHDAQNLVVRAMGTLFDHADAEFPPLRITMANRVPVGRGLGSSAAAIVGGLVAANSWLRLRDGVERFSQNEMLALASMLEGHPDNVSAALLGGLTIVVADGEEIVTARVRPPHDWRAVLFIPEQALSTKFARKVLPSRLSRADAVFNIGRAALLVQVFAQGDGKLLRTATSDRLHQPYREHLVPGMPELLQAAIEAGALGAALSGAGPTLIAFVDSKARMVAHAFEQRARELQVPGATRIVKLSAEGVRVEHS